MKAFLASLGMFTKIKVKNNVFEDNSGPDILCWFPFDGLICGLFTAVVCYALKYFDTNAFTASAVLLVSLFFISGFLHLDGFMDCADSLLSARDRETKIRILKDSTVGAFSVIAVCLLLICNFSFLYDIYNKDISVVVFILIPFMSRALFSLVLFTFKPLDTKGLLYYFNEGKGKRHIFSSIMWLIVSIVCTAGFDIRLLIAVIVDLICVFIIAKRVEKEFDGINGDVIGGGIILFECFAYFMISLIF